jgi:prolyl-tRNA synthetase
MGKSKTTFNISKKDNFSDWYSEILNKAEVTDLRYGVKGFVVIRPWGARIIDKMYRIYESALRATGHEATMMPAVIPEGNFKRESKHVEGFAPDVFWLDEACTSGDDKLALRPTSETAFYEMYNLWIRSYRDLPMKLYQRANVFRNETKATRPLIRSREFYWIETHDAFATKKEAEAQVQDDIVMTEEVMHKIFGVPFLPMKRPQWDKFPGAVYTVGNDVIMPDGKVIQQPSTHLIEQSFVKAFDVKFVDEKEKEKTPWLTCYGPTMSRIMASILAVHGDDNGLILPYTIAPVQVVIVPFAGKGVEKAVDEIRADLMNEYIDVKVDDSDKRPGEKFFYWEMKGVPFRIEIGEKELENDEVTLFIRDTKEKITLSMKELPESIKNLGAEYDERLLARADEFFSDKVVNCADKNAIKKVLDSGKIAKFSFCSAEKEGAECAEYIEKELQARVMGTRADLDEKASGKCPICGKKNIVVVYAGKSY